MPLKPALSSYLDFVRFIAALAVLLGHMQIDHLNVEWMPLWRFSHEAVVVFFVLSGFIIVYSTTSKASTWQHYAVARLSRVYSVALPAVVLCVVLAWWLPSLPGFDPRAMSGYRPVVLWDVLSSLLFINPAWGNTAELTLNGPYWSLCYEVWFYVALGACFFSKGRARWVLTGLAALVAGPPILLLMPIWLMGVWLFAARRYDTAWSAGVAWVAFVAPIVGVVFIDATGLDVLIQRTLYENVPGYWRLVSSQRFITDHLIGVAICLHIAAFSSLPLRVQMFFARYQTMFAGLAGFSFTLYLFHRPMTQVLGAWYPQPKDAVWQTALMVLGILLACWIISWGTEKQLSKWRRVFGGAIAWGARRKKPSLG